jgi:hypothetical protein
VININLFYNKLEGRRINNRVYNEIFTFKKDKIDKLIQRLNILYKNILIQKINILSINQYANISEIDTKLNIIIIELRKFNFKFKVDYFKYLYEFLSKEQDNICKNRSKRIIDIKKSYFEEELHKIKRS